LTLDVNPYRLDAAEAARYSSLRRGPASSEKGPMKKLSIDGLEPRGKRVLVRVDFNVPLDDAGEITDDRRIRESLPTIQKLMDRGARVILMSHLGRPKGKDPKLGLRPVADRLGELLRREVPLAPDSIGPEVHRLLQALGDGAVLLLENLRFHPGEEKNDPKFVDALASLGEIYVNDAFGTAHRAHASTEGVARKLPVRAAGYLLQKELDYLGKALESPKRPFVAIIGGAKISGKIDVIQALLQKVDTLLIGGGMAYTFFKAMGREIGRSIAEPDKVALARKILDENRAAGGKKVLLPVDCVAADRFADDADRIVVGADAIPADRECLDIGPRTIDLFSGAIRGAKTVVWNGPMGVFEMPSFAAGTLAVARALAECTRDGGITVVGGGDSAAAIAQAGLESQVTHVSTGGGASLEFLEGKKLPGVEVLTDAP
jgi:phosphoglycerate kinase